VAVDEWGTLCIAGGNLIRQQSSIQQSGLMKSPFSESGLIFFTDQQAKYIESGCLLFRRENEWLENLSIQVLQHPAVLDVDIKIEEFEQGCRLNIEWTPKNEEVAQTGSLISVAELPIEHLSVIDVDWKCLGVDLTLDQTQLTENNQRRQLAVKTDAETLKKYLKQYLPEFMIPVAFVEMDSFPLTANGKIDRKALPEPDQLNTVKQESFVEPATPTEVAMANIWQEIIGVSRVGKLDNFFDIGGHSLLATQVLSRLYDVFRVDLGVRLIFENPILQDFSNQIDEMQQKPSESSLGLHSHDETDRQLSFAQERLWFVDQFTPNSAIYNLPAASRIKGKLNIRALNQAINEILLRHDVLRSRFVIWDGNPQQVVDEHQAFLLEIIDLQSIADDKKAEEVEIQIQAEASLSFDLSRGSLLRTHLLKLNDAEFILMTNMHHIISDGWSYRIYMQEVIELYLAFDEDHSSPLTDLPIQYSDYAIWQKQWLQQSVLQQQLDYWRQQLSGDLPVLELPQDRPRPEVQTYCGKTLRFDLPENILRPLHKLAKQQDVTLYMILLTAFKVLLYRNTSQEDISVGVPVAGRNRSQLEPLIGLFVNTLVLRTQLAGNPSITELLKRVKETSLGAYANQDVPFEKLVEELHPSRDMGHSPLFQVMFINQKTDVLDQELPGLTISSMEIDPGVSKYDLTLYVDESVDHLRCSWEYNIDLFDEATIKRLAGHYYTLLETIPIIPDIQLNDLLIISDEERYQLLVHWNKTHQNFDQPLSLIQCFEYQAEQRADHIAIVDQNNTINYGDLNSKANQLAHWLINEENLIPGSLIAVSLDASIDLMVVILAIVKIGGVYVPIDPKFSTAKINTLLEESSVTHWLVDHSSQQNEVLIGITVVDVFDIASSLLNQSSNNLAIKSSEKSLAYLLFTTGLSKSTGIYHDALMNLLNWYQQEFQLNTDDNHLLMSSISFAMSQKILWTALITGGQLHCLSGFQQSKQIANAIEERQITRLNCAPSQFYPVLDAKGSDEWGSLKTVMFSGEILQTTRLINKLPDTTEVVNSCSIAECSDVVSFYRINNLSDYQNQYVPIGQPVANIQLYVMDAEQDPVPIGAQGELCIGGAGISSGYCNDDELSHQQFVPNYLSNSPEDRLFRTGDMVRYLSDGQLQYLGKVDDLVTFHGYRFSLNEINDVLRQQLNIRQSEVVICQNKVSKKQLIAYLSLVKNSKLDVNELRNKLKTHLAEYMLPEAFVVIDQMPMLANGKVNREELPVAKVEDFVGEKTSYVALTTPLEQVVAEIWGQVLEIEQVGAQDNFFELGGHSLLGNQVVVRLRQLLEVDLPVRSLFECPTVQAFALVVDKAILETSGLGALTLEPYANDEIKTLSFAQQRLWFLDQFDAHPALYNIPVALKLSGECRLDVLQMCFDNLMQRHQSLRTTFVADSEHQSIQKINNDLKCTISVSHCNDVAVDDIETTLLEIANKEVSQSFDLNNGPLIRVKVIEQAVDQWNLIITLHHIIADGWSVGILLNELLELYEATIAQSSPSLVELPVQYTDYAIWQRQWLQGDVLESQISYWQEKLEDVATLNLLTDEIRPPVISWDGAYENIEINGELTEQLNQLSQRSGVSLFMTLLSVFLVLLLRYSRQTDIAVGSPIAGRNHQEIENLVGLFINNLVLRTDLSGNPGFDQLLRRVREVALGAYAHQDVPFEQLVEHLQPERNVSHTPLFQVMFALQNSPMPDRQLSHIAVQMLEGVDTATAKYDLSLELWESNDGLQGRFEYNVRLFKVSTIKKMKQHFMNLVQAVILQPEQSINQLPMMDHYEIQQVIHEWNDNTAEFEQESTINQLFEQQVNNNSEQLAVVFEQNKLTYGQLNQQSNQLAHALIAEGIQAEEAVLISMNRSVELVVTVLAVLKAGACYVPLDSQYPIARQLDMSQQTAARFLITHSSTQSVLEDSNLIKINLDKFSWNDYSSQNLQQNQSSAQLSYILFTSGSTGKPKGVCVEHQSVVNLLTDFQQRKFLSVGKNCSWWTSFSFDVSVYEIFSPLLSGGCLHIIEDENRLDSEKLLTYLKQHNIHSAYLPPFMINDFAHFDINELELIRLLVGVEPILEIQLQQMQQKLPNLQIINGYGPSEATICATLYNIPAQPIKNHHQFASIGQAVQNVSVYILDNYGHPVPVGVAGEIVISGVGLARGYLNNEVLTKQRFIHNTYGLHRKNIDGIAKHATMYKTGDLARYQSDGQIQFIGRNDNQVKLRGYRIELGEIESQLKTIELIEQAHVMIRTNNDNSQLVAYLMASKTIEPETIYQYLKQQLPHYMIPNHFIALEEWPLTPNGKLDEKSLPLPHELNSSEQPIVLPENELQQIIANHWQRLLKLEQININENFFTAGGHSLIATELVNAISAELKRKIPLQLIFEYPTIVAFAEYIENNQTEQVETEEISVMNEDSIFEGMDDLSGDELDLLLRQLEDEG